MPVKVKKLSSGKYQVSHGGKVSAKATSKERAEAQEILLRAVSHGWKATGKPAKKPKAKKNKFYWGTAKDAILKRNRQNEAAFKTLNK